MTVREDMEKRIVERMEGAAAAAGNRGRPAVRAALLAVAAGAPSAAVRASLVYVLDPDR
ncbi:hypothetical protein [Nonomuraea jiangxiensis]|nr:hypothetical protein [Nonomuraea jiangxiensis]